LSAQLVTFGSTLKGELWISLPNIKLELATLSQSYEMEQE